MGLGDFFFSPGDPLHPDLDDDDDDEDDDDNPFGGPPPTSPLDDPSFDPDGEMPF